MRVVGIMSGTSIDGMELAVVDIADARPRPTVRFVAHEHHDFDAALRRDLLSAASGEPRTAADLALLNAALGEAYAGALTTFTRGLEPTPEAIGIHGQTVAHVPARHAGLQLGDAARVAVRTGMTVVSDFRSADLAAGGEGAPLVPFADHLLFADGAPRALLNLGGIANLTLLPTSERDDVRAFDTGPANMVSDLIAQRVGARFDPGGEGASRGSVVPGALEAALAHPYFARAAPKSTGREDFGAPFADALLAEVQRTGGSHDDALATAIELVARSVAEALARNTPRGVVWRDLIVAGGGVENVALMRRLAALVAPLPLRVADEIGIPAASREAVAFAVLAAFRLRGEPNTLPGCTGASRAVSGGAVHRP